MTEDTQDTISHLLARTAMLHRSTAYDLLSMVDLYPGQEFLLFDLARADGARLTELAARLCVEPPTITKMVRRMEAADLLERRPDATDRRGVRVWLTDLGRQRVSEAQSLWAELERRTVQGLSPRQQQDLRRLLVRVRTNLEGDAGPPVV